MHVFSFSERLQYLLMLCLLFIAYASCGKTIFYDPDAGWHLMAGQYMVHNFTIPTSDPFTFAADQTWYNISWLFDVAIYFIYHYCGENTLYYIVSFISAYTVLELYRGLAYWYPAYMPRLLIAFIFIFVLNELRFLRPQLFCYILVWYSLIILHIGRNNYRLYYYLPLIMLLWCNIHGSFLVLYLLGALYGLEAIWQKNWQRFKALLITGILCIVANIINPFGIDIFFATYRTLHSAMSQYIAEWHPWHLTWSYPFSGFLIFLLAVTFLTKSKYNGGIEGVLTLLWFVAAVKSIRFFVLFALFSAPYLAGRLQGCLSSRTWRYQNHALLCCLIVALGLHLPFKTWWQTQHVHFTHKEAVEYLVKHYPNEIVFNDYTLGGHLLFHSKAQNKYFLDGRAGTAFSEKFLTEYIELSFTKQRELKYFIDKYNFHVAILKLSSAEGRWLQNLFNLEKWRLVYHDIDTVIFEKP